MSLRLFVALDVPVDVRAAVDHALRTVRASQPELRWTDPAGWHLTLAFVGWVDESRAADVVAATDEAAMASRPFTLCLDGRLGSFGGRVLWAGIEPSEEAAAVAARLGVALGSRRFQLEDRPFAPHLTVARVPRTSRVRGRLEHGWQGPTSCWEADGLTVMRSRPSRSGATYEPWSVASLAG